MMMLVMMTHNKNAAAKIRFQFQIYFIQKTLTQVHSNANDDTYFEGGGGIFGYEEQ
jgi:hypothetical protein